ncbi:MAG: cation:proton antiporter [Acidimicrobiia bacterium]
MGFLFALGICLVVGAALSERARRTVLSVSALIFVAGTLLGRGLLDWVSLQPGDQVLGPLAELALITILFTDGSKLETKRAVRRWRLPVRALVIGLPMTGLIIGALAHELVHLPWTDSFLLGAVLSPTDPVLSEAIIGHAQVPSRLRDFLNVESGLNDGLALPFVVVLLSLLSQEQATVLGLSRQIGFGVGLGVLTPLAAVWLWNRRSFGVAERDWSIAPIAIVLVAVPAALLLDVNPFLASFTAGVTLGVVRPAYVEAFRPIGEGLSQLVKLGALFAFGLVFSHLIPETITWRSVVFAVAVLIVVRPVALLVAFAGHRLDPVLFATASWFGPKGFASVTFSLLVLQRGIDNGERIFSYASQVVGLSILAHSSTDVVIARKLAAREQRAQPSAD